MQPDEKDGGEVRPARRGIRVPKWVSLATAGFLLSVTLALINAFYAIRGSVVVVQPAQQIILYRDGDGERSVLTLGVRVSMINAADSGHGDVLMRAVASFGGHDGQFAFSSEIKPVFIAGDTSKISCELGSRCIALPGFLAIEKGEETFDIPGAGVRSPYLAFPLTASNCEGKGCTPFGNFDAAAAVLARQPLKATIELTFFSDGKRRMKCTATAIDLQYLRTKGWMTMGCTSSSVSGAPWI